MTPASKARRIRDETPSRGDSRDDFQRDRDIVLYTSALQRLSGITQVVSAGTGHVFHNRLTHTLQVAQVGRRLAEKLIQQQPDLAEHYGGLCPDVVETACLAHDLGHPPFGHVAEKVLDRLAGPEIEGFEGNAQSFRIVSELAFRSPDFNGLNLTVATLQAILKYPWTYGARPADKADPGKKRHKWGAYSSEAAIFAQATGHPTGPVPRCPEAELMDWADDLTYSVHDIEDFYRAGLIPLHSLRPSGKSLPSGSDPDRFLQYVGDRQAEIDELRGISKQELDAMLRELVFATFPLNSPYEGTRDQRAHLRKFTSTFVDRYINGLELCAPNQDGETVRKNRQFQAEIALWKQLTWFYVIDAPFLATQQHAQKQVVKYLYFVFRNESKRRPSNLLPPYYRDRLKAVPVGDPREKRVVIDLIAGMTEAQAIAVYQRLNGIVMGSALDKILV